MEQAATELQTFSQLKKQEDVAIPRRQEVNLMHENSNTFGAVFTAMIHFLFVFIHPHHDRPYGRMWRGKWRERENCSRDMESCWWRERRWSATLLNIEQHQSQICVLCYEHPDKSPQSYQQLVMKNKSFFSLLLMKPSVQQLCLSAKVCLCFFLCNIPSWVLGMLIGNLSFCISD